MTIAAALAVSGCAARAQDTTAAASGPSVVRVAQTATGYQLTRNGQPYFIKGAGGDGSKPMLRSAGGNSWRTWGADNLDGQLAEAQKLGMTVSIGIWLGHKDQGFNYHDAAQVATQQEAARQAVLRYRNSPALLVWGLGNEMESGQQDDPALWTAIENIAAMTKKLDPNHPTMTVVAELGGDKIKMINQYCPDIDIVGINSYAGAASIAQRYKEAGGVKPYIITEYGPPGTWEMKKNAWGAPPEPTSTEKATWVRNAYEKTIASQPLSLGSYAFTWGNKQEATATWFGLLLPDGSRLGSVDTLTQLWTGKSPATLCPIIHSLAVTGPDTVDPGTTVGATLNVTDPQNDPLKVDWVLQYDTLSYHTGGGAEVSPPTFPEAILSSSSTGAQVKMPSSGGGYRLYAYIHNNHQGAAVANIPLFVNGNGAAPAPPVRKAQLPLEIYGESGKDLPYIPSGYEGNYAAIQMDGNSTEMPHSGKTCLKAQYTASNNWGGVVWQSPANDWGDQPGGWNLTGAKKLTFWARGSKGGEVVSFVYGILKGKTYSDSGSGALNNVTLTKDWKQYSLDLAGVDLSDIKTGFGWTVASNGQPVTFYLDDIKYQ